MLQNLNNAIILGTIQNVISTYNAQLNNDNAPEQQILFGTFAAFKELMDLWRKDAINSGTSILPDTATREEREQFEYEDAGATFDKLMLLAAMLVDDDMPEDAINDIGTEDYGGENNPYDYSWFDGEIKCTNKTMLDYVVEWYNAYDQNKRHFGRYYNLVKALGMTPDMVWDFVLTH